MKITLNCSAFDFYCYNMQGPPKSRYFGERSHFHVHVTEPGIMTFECSDPLSNLIIVAPNGRVIHKKPYKNGNTSLKWNAKQEGKYLFKLWTWSIPDKYTVTLDGDGIIKAEQQIWSGGSSNKDGSLLEAGLEVKRKNGVFKYAPQTRSDRVKQDCR